MPEGMMKIRKRLLANEPSPPSSYVDVANAPWETSKFSSIEHKVLCNDRIPALLRCCFGWPLAPLRGGQKFFTEAKPG